MSKLPSWSTLSGKTFERARELRGRPSKAEAKLWLYLCRSQLGVRFRRQHPIGPFIADFYSREAKLVIELDGNSHGDPVQSEYDRSRTEYLAGRGLREIRFANADVLENAATVVEAIRSKLD